MRKPPKTVMIDIKKLVVGVRDYQFIQPSKAIANEVERILKGNS